MKNLTVWTVVCLIHGGWVAQLTAAQDPWARVGNDLVVANAKHGLGLALEGDTLLAGAPHAVAGTPEAEFDPLHLQPPGSLSIYEWNGDWTLTQFLRPSTSCENDQFGVSIVLDGDTAFVGSPGAIVAGVRTGAVVRFRRLQGTWVEQQILLPTQPQSFAGFGNHVDYDGRQLIVGAPFHDASGIEEWGRAFVFEEAAPGADWIETGVIIPPHMPPHSWAGYRVAIDGERAALGMFGAPFDGPGSGAICLLENNDGLAWRPTQQVRPDVPTNWSHFSYEMILRGDLLISGSYRAGPPGHHHGAVNIFRRRDATSGFVDTQRIVPPGLEFGAVFGVSCALLDNGQLAVGIPGAHGQAGRVGLYSVGSDMQYELDRIEYPPTVPSLESFGWKLATDGVRLAANGATGLHGGERRGVVHVWQPDAVEFETPRCEANNATPQNPRTVLLRSHGALDMDSFRTRLTVSEVPAGALLQLVAAPGQATGPGLGWGCLSGPAVRVSNTIDRADPGGAHTWWLGAIEATRACTAGTTWSFQAQAWSPGTRSVSNALDLYFRP